MIGLDSHPQEKRLGIEGYTADYVALQREVEDGAREHLDAVVTDDDRRTLGAKTIMPTSNEPAHTIASYARDAGIDLVIVGSHGRSSIDQLLIGSVAERVVRLTPCPVLMARHPAHERSRAEAHQIAAHV